MTCDETFEEIFCESQVHQRYRITGGTLQLEQLRTNSGTAHRSLSRARSFLKSWTGWPDKDMTARFQITPEDLRPSSDPMLWSQDRDDAEDAFIRALVKSMGKGVQVSGFMETHGRWIGIANSEGLRAQDLQNQKRLFLRIACPDTKAVDFLELITPDITVPWNLESVQSGIDDILRTLANRRKAVDSPTGPMPVVIGPASGAVVLHEACGHMLEASALEEGSPFEGLLGARITDFPLTIVDDPHREQFWGRRAMDDEGSPVQKVELLKDGCVQTFLNDRRFQMRNSMRLTASARRECFQRYPGPRMSCTYLEPGQSELGDMLSGIQHGLYVETIAGGTVQAGIGDFNFSVDQARVIRKGELCEPVLGALIEGNAFDFLKGISMVGRDLQFAPLLCGGSSGTLGVSVGQAHIKVDSLVVGK